MKLNEIGRSMIEMLGVLAIVGVLSVAGIAGYTQAMGKYKTNQLIAQITQIIIGTRTLYISQRSYADINISHLINTNVIPTIMRGTKDSSLTAYHAAGGEILVFPSPTAAQEAGAFELYATGITETTCKLLATIDWSQSTASGFISMYIGSGNITENQMESVITFADSNPEQGIYTPGTHDHSVPLSVTEAIEACDCHDTACTIGFKYK